MFLDRDLGVRPRAYCFGSSAARDSVLFSLILGKLFLSEQIGFRRSFFALVTFFGIAVLQFS